MRRTMDLIAIAIGLLPCAYAVYVLTMRLRGKNEVFKKLAPMKEKYGERTGSTIHYIAYAGVPFVVGVSIIVSGVLGFRILDWIVR